MSEARHHVVQTYASAARRISPGYDLDLRPLALKTFSANCHSDDEYLWQVSFKSLYQVQRYCGM